MPDRGERDLMRRLEREERRDPVRRAKVEAVRRAIEIPRLPRKRGVWVVSMVHNEADIIEATLTTAFEQGVTHALVADNGSTDETPQILREMAKHYPLSIASDPSVPFEQDVKTTHLAREAARHGATWVVPMDADEFWTVPGGNLVECLETSNADMEAGTSYPAFPVTSLARVTLADRFRLSLTPGRSYKMAVRAHPLMRIGMGNHTAVRGRSVTGRGAIRVTHVQWRSFEQLVRKVTRGKAAVELTDMDPGMCIHWRQLGGYSLEELREGWEAMLRGDEQVDRMMWRTVGPYRTAPMAELLQAHVLTPPDPVGASTT